MVKGIHRFWENMIWKVKHWLRLPDYQIKRTDHSPEEYDTGYLYLVGEEKPWFSEFLCPCGCNEVIKLKLFGDSPSWRIIGNDSQGITLKPSIWRTCGCQSHFFIRNSKVVWAKNIDNSSGFEGKF